jgi:RNA polymerase sigma-70 factor (ECF subfamily)
MAITNCWRAFGPVRSPCDFSAIMVRHDVRLRSVIPATSFGGTGGASVSASYAADLELARRCAAGDEQAWERFVLEYRPVLYRAADAIDPSGGARELADSIYADLYGKSLFRYFQGRSSLATWLRAVLSQRYVDRLRAQRRFQPLPDVERTLDSYEVRDAAPDPERSRDLHLLQQTLTLAIADLDPKDRLRLTCYYARSLTLAETGRVLKEHEATVSRQLARTRRAIRENVQRRLGDAGLSAAQIARCFATASEDAGPIDLDRMLAAAGRKETARDRSR